jgi:hypothetical protein
MAHTMISRRRVMGSSGLAVAGLWSRAVLGGEKQADAPSERAKRAQERVEQSRALVERMRDAASVEERMKIMEEQRAQERRRTIEDLQDELGVADREWPVLKPRIETVYHLVHPPLRVGPGSAPPRTEVEHRSRELRELLGDAKVPVDQIKGPGGQAPT